jgi:tetratricopeptide (TPR) repeat protein
MKRRQKLRNTVPPSKPAPAPAGAGVRGEWLLAAGLLVVTFLAYAPVLKCGFVNYDDDVYVTNNPKLQLGLTGPGIEWACTAVVSANWHPLTLLSLLLDHDLFSNQAGNQAWGYHLTNVLLHLGNTLLWFRCLCRMTGAVGRSAVVAALFALHPMHVEAVAWVGDRTDLLSTFFGLLALRAYLWHVGAPSAGRLATSTALLALSVMAKPIWLTFPFLLLLLDFWPLRRRAAGVSWRRLVLEKIPFLVVVAAGSVVAIMVHSRQGLIDATGGRYSLPARLANALISYAQYLRQTFVPIDLAVLYPHPGETVNGWAAAGAGLLLAAVSAFVIARIRAHPEWFVGWFWFVGTLVPLIGLVQFREVARADRYTYVAHVGLFLALTWAAADLLARRGRPQLVRAVTAIVLLICALFTYVQIGYWKDSLTLWEQTLRVTADNPMALQNYGEALAKAGRFVDAYKQFNAYVKLRPNEARGYRHRGHTQYELRKAALQAGDSQAAQRQAAAAAEDYEIALRLDPNLPEVHLNLGVIQLDYGRIDEAAANFLAAIQSDTHEIKVKAWYNLGTGRFRQKRFDEAEKCFREAASLQPDELDYQVAVADTLAETGQFVEAKAVLNAVLASRRVDPQSGFFRALQDRRQRFEKGQPYRPE